MIKITDKKECCGCSACAQRCPVQCIKLHSDNEGFLYPVIDKQQCINCGLCSRVCPVINQNSIQKPVTTYAAKNCDITLRKASSSGGIFTSLAERTINNGGVVFGAAFNCNWEIEHIHVDNINDIKKLRGSKYVQSQIGNSYAAAEKYLKEGKEVLFSGTPCQIVGFKRYLRKEYNNLTTVDVVCHGTPSPLVWRKYLEEVISRHSITHITDVQFRDKTDGWKNFSLSIKYIDTNGVEKIFRETLNENVFMKCFLSNLCLRPSCYSCPARSGKSGSDITLADLWGAENICPELDDDKGLSLILLMNKDLTIPNSNKKEIEYSEAIKYNPSIVTDVAIPQKRSQFFKIMHKKGICNATQQCTSQSKIEIFWNKIIWNIKNRIIK